MVDFLEYLDRFDVEGASFDSMALAGLHFALGLPSFSMHGHSYALAGLRGLGFAFAGLRLDLRGDNGLVGRKLG